MPKPPIARSANYEVMFDLETLGTKPGCVVLSVGAVIFDTVKLEITDEFYMVASQKSQLDLGLVPDPDTVAWWEKQSTEARLVLADSCSVKKSKGIGKVLDEFSKFVVSREDATTKGKTEVWSNGPEFDFVILEHAAGLANRTLPWKFWNNHSLRTIRKLYAKVPKVPMRAGAAHNALEDARNQAEHVMAIYRHIRGG